MPDFDWSDDRVADVQKMWKDGLSASQIATELGNGVSRNAVIGKLHRIGLNGANRGAKTTRTGAPPRARTIGRPRRAQSGGHILLNTEALELPPESITDKEIPVEQRRSLLQLTNETCRWPVGEPGHPDFFFCGGVADNSDNPYCATHRGVAFAGAPKGLPRSNNYRTFR